MVTDPYIAVDYSNLRAGMDCRGSSKEAVESTSWHRLGYICSGLVPVLLWMVDVSSGEEEAKTI